MEMGAHDSVDLSALGSAGSGSASRDQFVELFGPEVAPCRGMVSYRTPSALGRGEWSMLQNVRFDDGSLRVRFGAGTHSSYPSTGLPSGRVFRGGLLDHSIDLMAVKDGEFVDVYQLAGGEWKLVTNSETQYSGGSVDADVKFVSIRESVFPEFAPFGGSKGDWVIWQNSIDRPRIKSRNYTDADSVGIIEEMPAPKPTATIAKPVVLDSVGVAKLSAGDLSTTNSTKLNPTVPVLTGVGTY